LPSLPQKVSHLEQLLGHWQKPQHRSSPVIHQALAVIKQTKGQMGIPSLAEICSIGQRQLERLFQTQVGMSAKTYARLVRVQTARAALRQEQPLATAHLSQEMGFYDQSHFIREFQTLMGLTPQQYRQKRALRQQQQGQL
jgi:transcriptional regulator GlxA family with amidase domain